MVRLGQCVRRGGERALAEAVGQVHQRYTRRVNFRENWRGYLWQGRFGSFVLDEPYLVKAAAYVERNPVRAGVVRRAEAWPWSSAAAHVGGRGDAVAEGAWLVERTAGWVCRWGECLRGTEANETGGLLRRHASSGRPLGDEAFVKKIGTLLGRDLLPKKPGRKRKERK